MATNERKHQGSLTLGKLELVLESHEALLGDVTKLATLGDYTIATYDDADYPPTSSLLLLPSIAGAAPPAPAGATHLFDGMAMVIGQKMAVSAFRTA